MSQRVWDTADPTVLSWASSPTYLFRSLRTISRCLSAKLPESPRTIPRSSRWEMGRRLHGCRIISAPGTLPLCTSRLFEHKDPYKGDFRSIKSGRRFAMEDVVRPFGHSKGHHAGCRSDFSRYTLLHAREGETVYGDHAIFVHGSQPRCGLPTGEASARCIVAS